MEKKKERVQYKNDSDKDEEEFAQAYWDRAREEKKLESPEQIQDFLVDAGVNKDAASYLWKTGQLSKRPEKFKKFKLIIKMYRIIRYSVFITMKSVSKEAQKSI